MKNEKLNKENIKEYRLKKKNYKDRILNHESFSKMNLLIEVTTLENKDNKIYYHLHIGKKNKDKWYNQNMCVTKSDIDVLSSLIQKSKLFNCSLY